MSKKMQIAKVAQIAGVTKEVAEHCYTALVSVLADDILMQGKTELHTIGAFRATKRPARTGRNPRTGDKLEIAASVKVSFTASKALKMAVN